ncbi:hypothetical protein MPTK1_4g09640 [Marchantia polymorpha subsp. ruderalis]|uniref:Uncharacterized protein n=2 Tax=Marchantia polymorpha TaxID=3197 RepID=A0AAF6B863_MARPO|nr:hypothetical protein MARPO_0132s0007 [Marchantia polymorpha]BBN08197.1 hypothetical protein Mp_4g09640 [Marchantia polymorpha subsp. ruderalis]|eukprot:PTQ29927.1 hypothetical protein MARPO_0132s0007 [Marchantia polymorpha]
MDPEAVMIRSSLYRALASPKSVPRTIQSESVAHFVPCSAGHHVGRERERERERTRKNQAPGRVPDFALGLGRGFESRRE